MMLFPIDNSLWKKISLTIIFLIQIFSYLFTIVRNPGIPESKRYYLYPSGSNGIKRFRICRICKMYMNLDKKTYHCHICCICVEGLDHHCDFLNKCIGEKNLRSFYFFIIATNIYLCFSIYLAFNL